MVLAGIERIQILPLLLSRTLLLLALAVLPRIHMAAPAERMARIRCSLLSHLSAAGAAARPAWASMDVPVVLVVGRAGQHPEGLVPVDRDTPAAPATYLVLRVVVAVLVQLVVTESMIR